MMSSRPERAAERVLLALDITGPQDLQLLELIAWERGAVVRDRHLEGAEARLTVVGSRAVITVSTEIYDPRRRRFSIAHELGHLEMRRYHGGLTVCTKEDMDDWRPQHKDASHEQEANEFAAALLLPEPFFTPSCRSEEPSLDLIGNLADAFNVSLTATAIRFLKFCEEPCAVIFSRDEIIRWFKSNEAFRDIGAFVDVRTYVDPSSVAASLFKHPGTGAARRHVSASSWLVPGSYRTDAVVQEHSLVMPRYDAVLTLLWIDSDIESEDDDNYW